MIDDFMARGSLLCLVEDDRNHRDCHIRHFFKSLYLLQRKSKVVLAPYPWQLGKNVVIKYCADVSSMVMILFEM